MKNEIMTISGVRGYLDENGVAQLSLEDVSRGLGFTRIAASGNEVVRWERVREYLQQYNVPTSGHGVGKEGLPVYVPENIFYKLCFKAENKTAIDFQNLVTDEILPSIRRHGLYATEDTIERMLDDPDVLIKTLLRLKEEQQQRKVLETRIEEDKPYTEFAHSIANSSDSIYVGDFAKLACNSGINIGRNRLFKWLRDRNYLMENNKPYQKYVDQGLFEVKEYCVHTVYGDMNEFTTLVTGKGQMSLMEALRRELSGEAV